MSKHTPEPWIIWNGGDGIIMQGAKSPKRGGVALMCCNELVSGKAATANARRIVACVNACAGIPDKWLAEGPQRVWRELTASNDKMLSALRRIAAYPETSQKELGIEAIKAIARVAIDKAEGDGK